jgi:hypothetical protein
VRQIEPNIHNQSWAVLAKRDLEVSLEELARPGDDPREYAALRHNLVQVQREVERVQSDAREALDAERSAGERRLAAAVADGRRVYEESLSWRLTRPLRAGAELARAYRGRRRLR